jgi:hypothetical protein
MGSCGLIPCVNASDAPCAMRNFQASLTQVSPVSWRANTVAFPRGGSATGGHPISLGIRDGFASCRCGNPLEPLARTSIVLCVFPTTSIAWLRSSPSWIFPTRTKFAKSVEPPGMYPQSPAVRAPTGARVLHDWSCRDWSMQSARRVRE